MGEYLWKTLFWKLACVLVNGVSAKGRKAKGSEMQEGASLVSVEEMYSLL